MGFAGSDRFELRRQLGRGGMGVVYEAYDHVRGMRVALKTLRRLDANGLLRFKREFRSLSNLSHPNIIHFYELVADGQDWFFTMEFVDGQDLVSFVRAGPQPGDPRPGGTTGAPAAGADDDRPSVTALLDLDRLRDAMGQLADALRTLHAAAMVHCDLKPANVMVTREGRAVLMDFGVVSVARWASRGALDLVQLDQAEGTPAFMAPEQARGEPPGAAADWYAFGATLYLLLADRLPFENDTMQTLLDKQEIDPLPPSIFTRDIPPALEDLCMRLLARDPAARPGGEEVLAALDLRRRGDDGKRRASTLSHAESSLFVGRTRELLVLRRSYKAVCAGRLRCVLVDGPSGMGKSTLVGRFLQELDAADPRPLMLIGRCRERESLTYKAFDGLIDQLSLHLLEMPVRRRRAILPEGAALLARLFPVLRRVKELDVTARIAGGMELRQQAVRLLRALLGALAREQPIVACVDDLQWADRDSFALLAGLLEPPAPGGLLLLTTVRSASLHAGDNAILDQLMTSLAAEGAGYRISLGPLSVAEQRELVAQIGPAGGLPVAETLVQESAGHPMLLAELIRYAEEDPAELAAAGALHLEAVIWRRVLRLPAVARALVEAVAVAGEPAPLGILAQAAGLSPEDRERALSAVRAGHLVRTTRTGAEPWLDAYHDKVREALLEHMPAERVHALHGRLAQVMEPWDQAPTASLARHWLAAGEHDRAADYLLRAARSASEQLAFDRAAALYGSVTELLADRPSEPARDRHQCQAWLGLAQGMRLADRTDEALALLARAEDVAAAHAWRDELADIHSLRGNLLFIRQDMAGCLEQHARARSYAREIGSPRREASALGGLGDAYYIHGQLLAAHEHYARCIDLCREHGFADIEAANLSMRGLMRFHQNDLEAALRDGAAALALAARLGHQRAEIVAVIGCLSRVWCELGWLSSARAHLERARALARAMGSRRLEASALAALARLLAMHGHHDQADAAAHEALALMHETGRSFSNVVVQTACMMAIRDPAQRARLRDECAAQVEAGILVSVALWFHRDAMDLALAEGDHERVERHARAMEACVRHEPVPWARFMIERARLLAAHDQGRRDQDTAAGLERLFREACQTGFYAAAEALGKALAGAAVASIGPRNVPSSAE